MKTILTLVASVWCLFCVTAPAASIPNIVFIMVDDLGRAFGIGPIVTYSTKLGKSHLDFSACWIHDFDVTNRVAGNGFNFSASLKF